MTFHLGVDLGTTYSAAAVARDGRAEPATLDTRSVAIPSVIWLSGSELLVGRAAARRATTEPDRVAREFKRRVGDPTPLVLGGTPVSAELLMARLLDWIVTQVIASEGQPPASLAVTHPANWGEYKLDLLRGAIRHVGLNADHLVPEPVAAASFYASQRNLPPGSTVAVYDLGGGTFDAAVVRMEPAGPQIIGRPDGIERLGGIDFDHAVFRHVLDSLDVDMNLLDSDDPGEIAALAKLREDCVEAKEALSVETDVSIPVLLPNRHSEVRLTRSEFEAMIRPPLDETLVALRRAIDSAEIGLQDVHAVLLVGGSSRIPLIAQLVTSQLGRPAAVDARPKDAICLGAAMVASQAAAVTRVAPAPTPPPLQQPVEPAPEHAAAGPSSGAGTRGRWLLVGAIAAVVLLAGVAAFALRGSDDGDDPPVTTTEEATDPSDSDSTTTTASDSGDELTPLPGDDWNDEARTVFVDDCAKNATIASLGNPEDLCGCMYDDLEENPDVAFSDLKAAWAAGDSFDTSSPMGDAMQQAALGCATGR